MKKKLELSKFQCLQCQACCKQDGYVRLKPDEPESIAEFLNMSVDEFIEKHTRLTWDRQCLALLDKKNGECAFLTPEGCSINPVKPVQCLEFPIKWKFKAFETICAWAVKEKKLLNRTLKP